MILLDNVTKRFGSKILFENVSMQFDPGKRYGLTGANGAGKSTLIKMLASDEETDTGVITIPSSLKLGVLRQNHFEYDEERILDAVMMGNKTLWAALQEKEHLLKGHITDEIGMRLGELEGIISEENGYMAESDAAEFLSGLGILESKHESKMSSLDAGYKLRVLLAQVLFGRPDVLLLDEPTNHLDLESIRWLENFLTSYSGLVITISHDRHFLDAVATHIADVDYQTITVYTGGYTSFVSQKYENRQKAEAQNVAAKKKMVELQQFVDRFGSHASKSKQAQSRVKMIEKLEVKELKRSSLVRPFVRFEFEKPSGRDVVRIENVSKRFVDEKGATKEVYKGLNLNVNRGDRLALIGPNGVGKSTLLKLLMGASSAVDDDIRAYVLKPDQGEIRWGHECNVGYFAQDHHEAIGHSAVGVNAFQWLYRFNPNIAQEEIRGILGRLLFQGDAALKLTSALSGGECARLMLAKLVLLKHNVLILDEPTNHLDIESIEGMIDGLKLFKGTLIFVAHDRHFVASLATRIVELKPSPHGAKINEFVGTYEEYLEKYGQDYMRK